MSNFIDFAQVAALLYRNIYFIFYSGMPNGKPAGTRCIHLTDD
jgi:hypothetical protein